MNLYFAPMEGLTGYVYRNAHQAFFDDIVRYFAPFIVANQSKSFSTRELVDVLPENNRGITMIPQILSNSADDFIFTAKKLKTLGYDEINLNLGCPAGTVVAKYKGAGFLAKPEELDIFLSEIFSEAVTKISVKTRIGKDRPEEFQNLIGIFNKYPIEELIIHPRIQKEFYKGRPNLEVFREALILSKNPVCYNGDIFTKDNFDEFGSAFPEVKTVMLGRGMMTNPGLAEEIANGTRLSKDRLKAFHERIYADYKEVLSGDRNVLYKMKELWSYMILMFSDNTQYVKKIKKAESLCEFDVAIANLFLEKNIIQK